MPRRDAAAGRLGGGEGSAATRAGPAAGGPVAIAGAFVCADGGMSSAGGDGLRPGAGVDGTVMVGTYGADAMPAAGGVTIQPPTKPTVSAATPQSAKRNIGHLYAEGGASIN